MKDEPVTVWDDLGRARKIDRDEWREEHLPRLLEDAWQDADELYRRLVHAVDSGFAADIGAAALHLAKIDGGSERSVVLRAAIALQNADVDCSERILRDHIAQRGETGVVLTHLAKALHARGREDEALRTLRKGLELDPNQRHGAEWWAALHLERGGQHALREAMRELARLPGAWRPQLFEARACLDAGLEAEALRLYESVLDRSGDPREAARTISEDLGRAGMPAAVLELLEPIYDLAVHGPHSGINLVKAQLDTGRLAAARELLAAIQALQAPHLAEPLAELEEELRARTAHPEPDPNRVRVIAIDGPIWAHQSAEAATVLPTTRRTSPHVAFLSLADTTRGPDPGRIESITEFGRVARALPLFLAEAVRFRTDARTTALLPVVSGVGTILAGEVWDPEWILSACQPDEEPDVLVTGGLFAGCGTRRLQCWLHDCRHRVELARIELAVGGRCDGLANELAKRVIQELTRARRVRPRLRSGAFVAPRDPQQAAYLGALSSLLTQLLAASALVDPPPIRSERAMLAGYFELVTAMPASLAAKALAIRGVRAAHDYGSPSAERFERTLAAMLHEVRPARAPELFATAARNRR